MFVADSVRGPLRLHQISFYYPTHSSREVIVQFDLAQVRRMEDLRRFVESREAGQAQGRASEDGAERGLQADRGDMGEVCVPSAGT